MTDLVTSVPRSLDGINAVPPLSLAERFNDSTTRPARPVALPVQFQGIPEELQRLNRWLVWRYELEGEKWKKPPYSARTGRKIDESDPANWSTFDQARAAYERGRWDGIGIALGDGLAGADLDDCRKAGKLTPDAQRRIALLNSYSDISPTAGEGVKVFAYGTLPPAGRRKESEGIELYDGARYFTVTGHHLPGTPTTVEERTAEMAALHAELFPTVPSRQQATPAAAPCTLSDENILRAARNARNGAKFARLWNGDTSDYEGDNSRADLALCNILAYHSGNDPATIDGLFRLSGLMRDKWDEVHSKDGKTYGALTIARAIRDTVPYTPRRIVDTPNPDGDERLRARIAELEAENARLKAQRNTLQTVLRHPAFDTSHRTLLANLLLDAAPQPEAPGYLFVEDASNPKLAERYNMSKATIQRSRQQLKCAGTVQLIEHKIWEDRRGKPLPHPYTDSVTLVLPALDALELPDELPTTPRIEKNRERSRELARALAGARCPECGTVGCLHLVCGECGTIIRPEEDSEPEEEKPQEAPPCQIDTPPGGHAILAGEAGGDGKLTPQSDTPCQIDTPSQGEAEISTLSTGGGILPATHAPPPVESVDIGNEESEKDAVALDSEAAGCLTLAHWNPVRLLEILPHLPPARQDHYRAELAAAQRSRRAVAAD